MSERVARKSTATSYVRILPYTPYIHTRIGLASLASLAS